MSCPCLNDAEVGMACLVLGLSCFSKVVRRLPENVIRREFCNMVCGQIKGSARYWHSVALFSTCIGRKSLVTFGGSDG